MDVKSIAPKIDGSVISQQAGYLIFFERVSDAPDQYVIQFEDSVATIAVANGNSVSSILNIGEIEQLLRHGARLRVAADTLHAFRLWCLLRPDAHTPEELWRAVGVNGNFDCPKNVCCTVHSAAPVIVFPYRRNGIQHLLVSCLHCGNKVIALRGEFPIQVGAVGRLIAGKDGLYFNPETEERDLRSPHLLALLEEN